MSFKIRIAEPCTKKYDELTVVDSSCRFCTVCNLKVYDFTDCTPEEFLAIYTANKGKVCGQILKETPKEETRVERKSTRLRYWLMSFLAFFGVTSCSFFNDPDPEIHVLGGIMPIEISDTLILDNDTSTTTSQSL